MQTLKDRPRWTILEKIDILFLAARAQKISEAAVVGVVLKVLQHFSSSTEKL